MQNKITFPHIFLGIRLNFNGSVKEIYLSVLSRTIIEDDVLQQRAYLLKGWPYCVWDAYGSTKTLRSVHLWSYRCYVFSIRTRTTLYGYPFNKYALCCRTSSSIIVRERTLRYISLTLPLKLSLMPKKMWGNVILFCMIPQIENYLQLYTLAHGLRLPSWLNRLL
jgi:hypothetical protein